MSTVEQDRRAARIRDTAELFGELVSAFAGVVVTHAEDIAAWTLRQRRDKCKNVTVVTTAREKTP